jgi:membrane-bound ClpP family serine protease
VIPYLFLFTGILLIYLEFYLPGAVFGTVGGLLVLTAIFQSFMLYESLWAALAFSTLAVVLVAAVIKFALWQIPRQKSGMSIYSSGDQQGYQASTFDQSAIGKIGTVLSDLRPGGYILIDGVQHQALSESGYLVKGTPVKVIRGEGDSLIVKEEAK